MSKNLIRVADGVWLKRGGLPPTMNVYLIEDIDGGVTLFDAGVKSMTGSLIQAAAPLGGINRVVLGHSHGDHRGAAPGLGAPVFCHPAERADAEGDGGLHYADESKLNPLGRVVLPRLLRMWDGGPVPITGTVEEGEDVSGFEVVHIPGHAPGQIALWRSRDRLLLSTDAFYTLDPQSGLKGRARIPHVAYNQDTDELRASLLKLAALDAAAAWPGHADPVTGDVRSILEKVAKS
jgi:glyoxylase-like metal-dependent hydrolase (beta-lactamase superfamily II)